MKRIKVIQVGTGHDHAAGTMLTLRDLIKYYEVLGIWEPDPALRREAERNPVYAGTPFLNPDDVPVKAGADAFFIETQEDKLVDYAQLFADRGYPVHMDKPGGIQMERFEKLVRTMKNQDLAFQMGYMYRYNKAVQRALQMKKEGVLGEIFSVEAQMSVRHNKQKREWLSQFAGGMMYFLGCHLVDIVYMFCGYPDQIIPFNCSTFTDGVQSKDYGFAVYRYSNGISFVKTNAAEVNGFARRQIVITGSRGSIEINPIEMLEEGSDLLRRSRIKYTLDNGTDAYVWADAGKTEITNVFSRYEDMLIDFALIVRKEKENPFGYDYELEMHEMFLRSCGKKQYKGAWKC